MVVVPGFGGSCLAPRGAATGNTWLSPRVLTDPWTWMRLNGVEYGAATGEFASTNPLLGARGFGGEDGACDLCPEAGALEGVLRLTGGGPLPFRPRYFGPLRDALRADGTSRMYSATYDFRRILDPRVLAAYRLDLLNLVARARAEAGGRRAVIVAHSMGCVLANHLLLSDPEWLEDNVASVLDVCPNSEGSAVALDCMLHGRLYLGTADGALKAALARMARNNAGLILSLPYLEHDDYGPLVGDAWVRYALPIMASLRSPAVPGKVGHLLVHGTGRATPTGRPDGGLTDGDGIALRESRSCPSRLVGPGTVLLATEDAHSAAPGGELVVSLVRFLAAR